MTSGRTAIVLALGSAVLFGLGAPAAKLLLARVDPWLLAGLLYGASGVGLGLLQAARRSFSRVEITEAPLRRRDWPWLGGAILTGGVGGPVLLMFGLAKGRASDAALLLNLEGVFTALLAWFVFREHFDRRIAGGMTAISAGAVVLAWDPVQGFAPSWSALCVTAACAVWALDNNLTRKVSASDPIQIAALKGATAGAVNIGLASLRDAAAPGGVTIAASAVVGLLSFGLSLVLYIVALRHLGAGRTGAYFSTAPFVGAVAGVLVLGEPVTLRLVVAAALMALGVGLHVSERHEHEHAHEPLEHEHLHWHDEHHRHGHLPGMPIREPHTHLHVHEPVAHRHPHFPDIHHRHGH